MSDDQKIRLRAIWISIIVGTLILGAKFIAFWISDSTALKSDAIESVVNVISAVFALGSIIFAGRPADKNHPYGHGKIEYFSAVFEGGLISIASVFIFYEAIKALAFPSPLQNLSGGLLINFGAGLLNGALGIFLIRTGRRHSSKAMEADGMHVLSDFYTTIGLALGLLLVKLTGILWLDPVLAMIVGALLAYTGFKLVRSSSAALLDSEDPKMIEKISEVMNRLRTTDIIAVHELRTLRTGRFTHVDLHIVVPEFYEIKRAHDLVEEFGETVILDAKLEGEFHSHIDPCARAFCELCPVEPCPIRQKPFSGNRIVINSETATAMGPRELGMSHYRS
jgi:cation diffusion facilitator family transporter